MRPMLLVKFALLFVSVLIPQYSFARNFTQLALPQGAVQRLGKGRISGNIAYSPDGTRLAVAGSVGIWIYDAETGALVDLFTGHTGEIYSVSYSSDGLTLASGSSDKTIRMWDARTGESLYILNGLRYSITSVSYSPDGAQFASRSAGDGTMCLWDSRTGERLHVLEKRKHSAHPIAFSPDGGILANGGWSGRVDLWDARTGKHLKTLEGHTRPMNIVSYSTTCFVFPRWYFARQREFGHADSIVGCTRRRVST